MYDFSKLKTTVLCALKGQLYVSYSEDTDDLAS